MKCLIVFMENIDVCKNEFSRKAQQWLKSLFGFKQISQMCHLTQKSNFITRFRSWSRNVDMCCV